MNTSARGEFLRRVFGITDPQDFEWEEYLLDLTLQGTFLTKEDYQAHTDNPDDLVGIWEARLLERLKNEYGIELQTTNVRIDDVAEQVMACA